MSLDREAFDRAWDAGCRHGTSAGVVATVYADVVDEILRICGVSTADACMIREQAEFDAQVAHPELTLVERRALAAQRVVRLVLHGLVARSDQQNQ
jgi:hypothetical protein